MAVCVHCGELKHHSPTCPVAGMTEAMIERHIRETREALEEA